MTDRQPIWHRGRVDLGRRRTLLGLGASATSALATTETLAQAASCVLTADAGEGPFYFDPGLLRTDIKEGAEGAPLDIAIQITRASDCATLANARLDLWHADGLGLYSGYSNQPGVGGGLSTDRAVGQSYLRGTQFTDADGWVRFRTIYPSWYGNRTPHLHFKVLIDDAELVASQIFFPDEVNAAVFENWLPYRDHIERRTTFNHNDTIPGGVVCEVEQNDTNGVSASAVIAVGEA